MNTGPKLAVTVSVELLKRLRAEARVLGVPLEWMIASLVVDTVDPVSVEQDTMDFACA